jgi:hypothetical protein
MLTDYPFKSYNDELPKANATPCLTKVPWAIEGVGFDGRVNAYRNAADDGCELDALNRGARDSLRHAGWCVGPRVKESRGI